MHAKTFGVIAVTGCRRAADSAPDDIYPDPDAPHLQDALGALGATSRMVSWDDPSIDWRQFSHVVISSTWDSVDRPDEYVAWARHVADISTLVNPVELIEWNIDKTHQRELAAAGVPTIPTDWVAPGDIWLPPATGELVIKPAISAGGRSTARYAAGDAAAIAHVRALHEEGRTAMAQPYLDAIDAEGEIDVVLFDGAYSHAVKKRPALQVGAAPGERPWERMAWDGVVVPTAAEMAVVDAAMTVIRGRFARYPTFARVDLITGAGGTPTVLEIELIDPYLSLDMEPAAASRMAAAILRS